MDILCINQFHRFDQSDEIFHFPLQSGMLLRSIGRWNESGQFVEM